MNNFLIFLIFLSFNVMSFDFVLAEEPVSLTSYSIKKDESLKSVLIRWCNNDVSKCDVLYQVDSFKLSFTRDYNIENESLIGAVKYLFSRLGNRQIDFRFYKNNKLRICEKRCI